MLVGSSTGDGAPCPQPPACRRPRDRRRRSVAEAVPDRRCHGCGRLPPRRSTGSSRSTQSTRSSRSTRSTRWTQQTRPRPANRPTAPSRTTAPTPTTRRTAPTPGSATRAPTMLSETTGLRPRAQATERRRPRDAALPLALKNPPMSEPRTVNGVGWRGTTGQPALGRVLRIMAHASPARDASRRTYRFTA
jgi:hypothetical protein